MRIWPVILDSQPAYLHGRGKSSSLLLAPLGHSVLIEHLAAALAQITDNAPLIVAAEDRDERFDEWVHALYPKANVITAPQQFADAMAGHELSDAVLFIDPRCMPVRGLQLGNLLRQHAAESRVAHHLVAFEPSVAGTRERVCVDGRGQVRAIQRLYEQMTWAQISGVAATIVPGSFPISADGDMPRSLRALRHTLLDQGVPSRDVGIDGGALDLNEERGILAANEQLLIEAVSFRTEEASAPVRVGDGHTIHETARMMGPVVVHPGASIDANATVLGPAVVGRGAKIGAGAVVAHATIGPDCVVPPNAVVRDRAWFKGSADHVFGGTERPPVSYTDRLARLSLDAGHQDAAVAPGDLHPGTPRSVKLKRALDVTAAALGLLVLSPLLILIAIAVWLESRSPIFYGDKREGMGGRLFKCWKFRTMYTGAHLAQRDLKALDQTDGPHFKVAFDPRVTKVGRLLRAANLDELPQLYNVLIGEMSLVGPRPSPFRENQVCVPWRAARLAVRPGITGFWQVCRHNRSEGDFHQWIEYDLLYVQHLSFWLDIKILTATLLTLGGKLKAVPASRLVSNEPSLASDAIPAGPVQPKHEAERVA